MRALRAQGWAYRQIRKEGARRGWTSRAGKAFTLQAVFDLVKDAECGALVDNSTFDTVIACDAHITVSAKQGRRKPRPFSCWLRTACYR